MRRSATLRNPWDMGSENCKISEYSFHAHWGSVIFMTAVWKSSSSDHIVHTVDNKYPFEIDFWLNSESIKFQGYIIKNIGIGKICIFRNKIERVYHELATLIIILFLNQSSLVVPAVASQSTFHFQFFNIHWLVFKPSGYIRAGLVYKRARYA